MKICANCRSSVPDDKSVCPNCGGTSLKYSQKTMNQQESIPGQMPGPIPGQMPRAIFGQVPDQTQNIIVEDRCSPVLYILSFICPIVGIILYLAWKEIKPQSAREVFKISLFSCVLIIIFIIVKKYSII